MNDKNLRATAAAIRAAGRLNMSKWTLLEGGDCATPCCIGGFAASLTLAGNEYLGANGVFVDDAEQFACYLESITERAANFLGLDLDEEEKLFATSWTIEWPAPYDRRYENASDDAARAAVAADLLDALAAGEVTL